MSDTTNKRRAAFIAEIRKLFPWSPGTEPEFSRAELKTVSDSLGQKWIPNWITHDSNRRVSRGLFSIPEVYAEDVAQAQAQALPESDLVAAAVG